MDKKFFNDGAIWHGPWHTGLVSGRFGSPKKRHWAMAMGNSTAPKNHPSLVKAFFPFTSKKHTPAKTILIFQPETLPFGRSCESFLLPLRLVARKTDLEKRFKFTTFIPGEFYQ